MAAFEAARSAIAFRSRDLRELDAGRVLRDDRSPPRREAAPAYPRSIRSPQLRRSPRTNEHAARTLGPIEPAANSECGDASGVARGSRVAAACPTRRRRRRRRSRYGVRRRRSSLASSALARSLSITASTPTRRRPAGTSSSTYMTGIPPPPAQTRRPRGRAATRTGSMPKIRFGRGRRHDAAETVAVRPEGPALLVGQPLRVRLLVDRPDRLRGSRTPGRRGRPRSA